MPITARIRSVTKRTELRKLGTNLQHIVAVQDKHAQDAIARLKIEPAPKAGSKYIRTHTAIKSWHGPFTTVTQDGIVTRIKNNATDPRGRQYSEIVYGDESGRGQNPFDNIAPDWPLMAEEIRRGYRDKIRKAVRETLGTE